jgi:hypothetical protein
LIEEYFDGEVTEQTAATVRTHLAACADCAAALDALSFEQEIYARYDRGGLEVAPDLWARVSAEIARTPPTELQGERRPFLSRARASFVAALGALAVRPALASALALLFVAATVGTLWLTRRPNVPAQVAVNTPGTAPVISPAANTNENRGTTPVEVPSKVGSSELTPVSAGLPSKEMREPGTAPDVRATRRDGGAGVSVDALLAGTSGLKDDPNLVNFTPENHGRVDDTAALFVNTSAPGRNVAGTDTRLLDPEQKDVARHVERAQMLLRSIKNVRASDAGDITYEKNLSRKLLAENATLQLEAEVKGDKETKQVLDRIEPFLLEIANMDDKPSREDVRSIRERVRRNEIVAALEVY